MQIFENKFKDYYWDTNWDYLFDPVTTIYKITAGNYVTLIENLELEWDNAHSLQGRVTQFGRDIFYKVQSKKPPGCINTFLKNHPAIKEVSIALLIFVVVTPVFKYVFNSLVTHVLVKKGYPLNKQSVETMMESICNSTCDSSIMNQFIKAYSIGYLSFFGPAYEEDFFRGSILNWIKGWQKKPDTTVAKASRIAINSLAFGAYHMNPFIGMYNMPIFVVVSLMGAILATLKETRQNLYACNTLHILNNSVFCLRFLKA